LSLSDVGHGAFFLLVGYVISRVLGFVSVVLVSRYGGVDVVGVSNAIAALSVVISDIVILGIPTGATRLLGRELGHNNIKKLNRYFWSSLVATLALSLFSVLIIWAVAFLHISVSGFSDSMLFFVGVLVLLGSFSLLGSLFTTTTRTGAWALSVTISGIVRLVLVVYWVYLGLGWFGVVVGGIIGTLLQISLLTLFALKELRRLGPIEVQISGKAVRESLHASVPAYFPGIVYILAQQLGLLLVFGSLGSFDAGTYSVAFTIFTVALMLPTTLSNVLFPALSGLDAEKREVLTQRVMKICLAMACPIALFLALYPELPLSLVGKQYLEASLPLSILLISIIPLTYLSTVGSLIYASGHYGKSIATDLLTGIPQIITYFILVPIYGGVGAALSYCGGVLIGSVVAMVVSRVIRFRVPSRKIAIAVLVPFAVALPCYLLRSGWLISGTMILLCSVVAYGRMGVVERGDLADIARGLASEKTVAKTGKRLHWLLRLVYGN
jgi:O-antigen/teichoic acid export membrane protein